MDVLLTVSQDSIPFLNRDVICHIQESFVYGVVGDDIVERYSEGTSIVT